MKYELVQESKKELVINKLKTGVFIYQIRLLTDMPTIKKKKGSLGGWVESENNLAQDDDSWINSGTVFGNALVAGNALVFGKDKTFINGDSRILGGAMVNNSIIQGSSLVNGTSEVHSSQLKDVTFYDGVHCRFSKIEHLTAWNANIVKSTLMGKTETSSIFLSKHEVTSKITESIFIFTGKNRLHIRHPIFIHSSSFKDMKRFSLQTPLTIENVHSPNRTHLFTEKSKSDLDNNRLSSKDDMLIVSKLVLRLKNSEIVRDGRMGGKINFENTKVSGIGDICNWTQKKLSFMDCQIEELATILKTNDKDIVDDTVFAGETFASDIHIRL